MEQGLRGVRLLIEVNADRLLFPLAVVAALALAAVVGGEMMHPVIPIEPFLP